MTVQHWDIDRIDREMREAIEKGAADAIKADSGEENRRFIETQKRYQTHQHAIMLDTFRMANEEIPASATSQAAALMIVQLTSNLAKLYGPGFFDLLIAKMGDLSAGKDRVNSRCVNAAPIQGGRA
uniref:hypothetical protein n=1 Tax=Stappia sp. TaxID=1870903 RepID=UPI003BAD76C2